MIAISFKNKTQFVLMNNFFALISSKVCIIHKNQMKNLWDTLKQNCKILILKALFRQKDTPFCKLAATIKLLLAIDFILLYYSVNCKFVFLNRVFVNCLSKLEFCEVTKKPN